MAILLSVVFFALGIVILLKSADWLVSGASSIAARFKISPMVIGLTVVAFGTSAPELVVSLTSAISGNTNLALSNIIGSNIANILLILGASAILLICAILTIDEIKNFSAIAKSLDLDVLLETHDEKEMKMAIESDADIIGINNRNLSTFELTIDTTLNLLPMIPEGKVVVSESGFHTAEDIAKLKGTRVNAILVGESFMRTDNIEKKAQEFRNNFMGV